GVEAEEQEIRQGKEGVINCGVRGRDRRVKDKLDRFLERAKSTLGQLTKLFHDQEGGGMPPPGALDDATMNQLLKNLIAKLLEKDFPGYAEGDKLALDELGKKRSPVQEQRARRAESTL